VLLALRTYQSGHGQKGSGSWNAVPRIVSALDQAFYKCFANVEPTNKNFYIGIDCSGSMSSPFGNTSVTSIEAAAAMALVTMKVEPRCYVYGFNNHMVDIGLHDSMTLEQASRKCLAVNWGSTDCAVAFNHAADNRMEVDTFLTITDNDTWAGRRNHPFQALNSYRQKMGRAQTKSIVMATYPSPFSIADPKDPYSLDIVGFDTAVPQLISEFTKM